MIENLKIKSLLKQITEKEHIKDYLLVMYGHFDQVMIISTIKLVERKLQLEKFPANIITKTKIICVEMLQNITKHRNTNDSDLPYFIIGTNDKTLNILSGNIVTKESKQNIENKLNEFVKVDKNTFKEYYMQAFKNSALTEQGNAGLGLLEIVYRSNQNVKFNMQSITEDYYSFNLDVLINKTVEV